MSLAPDGGNSQLPFGGFPMTLCLCLCLGDQLASESGCVCAVPYEMHHSDGLVAVAAAAISREMSV